MEILLPISIALLAGLMLSRLAKLAQLPAVTAYLVAGVLIGPYCLGALGIEGIGFISMENVKSYSVVCDVALGFIAFSIGNEFRLSSLKKIGKQATVIGIAQALVTTLVVDVALIALHFAMPEALPIPAAIVLGAVATATAPAATLMVVRQYKAKGPVTDILLPVVALDDAVGLVVFAVSFGVAKAIGVGHTDVLSIVVEPILEVVLSLVLGAVIGVLFHLSERFFHSNTKRLGMSVAFVLLAVAISSIDNLHIGTVHIAFSPLLVCMMMGTVFCNICDFSEELSVFSSLSVVIIGIVYIISRSVGKCSGAFASAKLMKCDDNIVKYLGITLLPQAGVALGMAIKARELGPEGTIVANITLFAVLVYELVGPLLTKIALTKAGDIKPEEKSSTRNKIKEALANRDSSNS